MIKMKKNKNNIFCFLLVALLFSSIGVVAVTLTAKDVSYSLSNSEFSVVNIKLWMNWMN